jgi:hypothetical protein
MSATGCRQRNGAKSTRAVLTENEWGLVNSVLYQHEMGHSPPTEKQIAYLRWIIIRDAGVVLF